MPLGSSESGEVFNIGFARGVIVNMGPVRPHFGLGLSPQACSLLLEGNQRFKSFVSFAFMFIHGSQLFFFLFACVPYATDSMGTFFYFFISLNYASQPFCFILFLCPLVRKLEVVFTSV